MVASCWFFSMRFIPRITMHGSMNIKFILVVFYQNVVIREEKDVGTALPCHVSTESSKVSF